jgi:hypothetical protein
VTELWDGPTPGIFLAACAVGFWYEAPIWARKRIRNGKVSVRDDEPMDGLMPSPQQVRMLTVIYRLIAVGCFVSGVLTAVGRFAE